MKKIQVTLVLLFAVTFANAQVVSFPDINFKLKLLSANTTTNQIAKNLAGNWTVIDTNNDGLIQQSEAQATTDLTILNSSITNFTGLNAFINLVNFKCLDSNTIDAVISFSNMNSLQSIEINRNIIINLNNNLALNSLKLKNVSFNNLTITNCPNIKILFLNLAGIINFNTALYPELEHLSLEGNNITSINLSNLTFIKYLNLSSTLLTVIDISTNLLLEELHLDYVGAFEPINGGYFVHYSSLNSINLSNNILLKKFSALGMKLPNGIDFSNLSLLEYVNIYGDPNNLPEYGIYISNHDVANVNFNGCLNLKEVYLQNCKLQNTILDLSNRSHLEILNISNDDYNYPLQSLNLSNCNSLNFLFIPNGIISLNLSNCSNLKNVNAEEFDVNGFLNYFYINSTPTTSKLNFLDISNCGLLKKINVGGQELSNLSLMGCNSLEILEAQNNQLTSLDLSSCGNLQSVNCDNNNLEYVSFKNNTNETKTFLNNPNLTYICADEIEQQSVQYIVNVYELWDTCVVGDYCSFTPNGNFNTISGNALYDNETDGCDTNDEAFEFLRVNINDGTNSGSTFTNFEGNYKFYGNAGTFTLTPQLENPTYFNVSPSTTQISFANANNNSASQDFCITPNGTHTDLEVVFAPITPARPGFDAEYNLVFKNKGNQPLSGSVSVAFEDSKMDFLNSTLVPTSNSNGLLSWDYTNLLPFENRSVVLTFNVNNPTETPAVNNGDVLTFNANGTPISGDEIPTDNAFVLHQTVVGSYDPNDIYCLEGDVVDPALIGQYLHYNVRFENTGTAAAENIVVATTINSADYDIDSLQVLNASNPVYTRITGNFVEFIFENIQLAGSPSGGHGHILFKMKSKSNLQNSDEVTSNANIFFDYNFPIETNDATTTFETLNNQEFVKDNSVKIYPNPTASIINISCNSSINTIELFDVQGRLLQVKTSSSDKNTLDLSDKTNGIYFLKITTENGSKVEKIVKE